MTTVAVLGTGTMGAAMARSLLRAGLSVRAWNRTRAKAAPLADDGATVHDTAVEAVTGADVVLVVLFGIDSVVAVLDQVGDALGDAVVVQSSTVGLDVEQLVGRGLRLVDAPVLGTKAPAEQGRLTVLASGDPSLRASVQPVFDAIGSTTHWVADSVGPASALKLACNSWVASVNAGTAQAIALAEGLGLDPQLFIDAVSGSAVDAPYVAIKGAAMIDGSAEAGENVSFELDGVSKDLGLIIAAARRRGVATDVLDGLGAVYARASAAGHGDHDMAAVRAGFAVDPD